MERERVVCPTCGSPNAYMYEYRHTVRGTLVRTVKCSPCYQRKQRERLARARVALGGACVRCGIRNPIAFDHIGDDGYLNRKPNARGKVDRLKITVAEGKELTQILRTGRSDRLQLLCHNCNHLKSYDPEEYARPPTYGPLGQA